MMDRPMRRELGITAMGEALSILKQAKELSTQTIYAKAPSTKLPQQFRKFQIDWEVLARMTDMPTSQTSYTVVPMNPSKIQLSTPTLSSSLVTKTSC